MLTSPKPEQRPKLTWRSIRQVVSNSLPHELLPIAKFKFVLLLQPAEL